ncbi:MAG: hypothetical protein ACI9UJ_002622 [bacterium]
MPPKGTHVWRQSNTSAVTRNFVEEDMNILKPRVDRRRNTDGVTGMQFPSFEFSAALLCWINGGYFEASNRIVAFLFFAFSIFYFYRWAYILTKSRLKSFWSTYMYTWCPILFYHAISALPDVLALTASVAALYHFFKHDQLRRPKDIAWLLFWLTLAGLTKLQYLMVGIPMAAITLQRFLAKDYKQSTFLKIAAVGISSLGISIAWYVHAANLITSTGLDDFGIKINPETNITNALLIIKENLLEIFPELIFGYAGVLGFLYFLFKNNSIRRPFSHSILPFTVWFFGMLAYHFIELVQMREHVYYMFPYLPLLLLAAGLGIYQLTKVHKFWLYFFLVLLPISAFGRVFHHWTGEKNNATAVFYHVDREKLVSVIPKGALTIVGPDETGCVFHYFTETKGFTFASQNDLIQTDNTSKRFDTYVAEGAQFFILGNGEMPNPQILPFLGKPIFTFETLTIYPIILPNALTVGQIPFKH